MENDTLKGVTKTPSNSKATPCLRLFSGTSLLLFSLFLIFCVVYFIKGGDAANWGVIPVAAVIVYPIVFSLLLFIKGLKAKKGWLFGLSTAGLIALGVTLYILVAVLLIVLGLSGAGSCQNSSSSSTLSSAVLSSVSSSTASSSAACAERDRTINSLAIFAILLVGAGIAHEIVLGLSLFGKKPLKLLLYIFSGLYILASTAFGIVLLLAVTPELWFFILPFIGIDFLILSTGFAAPLLDEEKASPYPEDAPEK